MKRTLVMLASLLVLAASLAAVLYPVISSSLADKRNEAAVVGIKTRVEKASAAELTAEKRAAEAYNAALLSAAAAAPTRERYDELLNLGGDGIMGVLYVPCIGVSLPIYHGTDDSVLNRGAGHICGTSLPVGGKGTHAVISAHSGMTGQRMLTDLDRLAVGDEFSVYVLGERLYYRVDSVKTVLPDDTSDLAISGDRDYITLVTCTPYGVNSHRLLVRGERFFPADGADESSTAAEKPKKSGASTWTVQYLKGIAFGLATVFSALAVYFISRKILRKVKKK